MITIEPSVSDNQRLSIGEAANLLGINRGTLRRHTEQGYIRCGFSKVNNRRFYLGKEIKKYWKLSY